MRLSREPTGRPARPRGGQALTDKEQPWFAGAFFWKWYPGDVRVRGIDFSPQGQPAEAVLAKWYGLVARESAASGPE